jgi:hypothetical protein
VYVADFIPSRSGTFIFNFTGSIEGSPINERFESGPGRFDDVASLDALQFPQAIPDNTAMAVQFDSPRHAHRVGRALRTRQDAANAAA